MSDALAPLLIDGLWQPSSSSEYFQAENPALGEPLPERYPIATRDEVLAAVEAGVAAAEALRTTDGATIARFLEALADAIERSRDELVSLAHAESGLAKSPRLMEVELPRTTDQLRQAADAARSGSWRQPIRDEARGISSVRAPLGGPVVIMGPNNFPFAFNSVAGGDFAAALAAHNPVIVKANPGHPGTTLLLVRLADEAARSAGLHPATVQLLYHMPPEVGLELVAHPLIGAVAFTGSRRAGLALKAAADRGGRPIYLELSSVNPVVLLEGALAERGDAIAEEFFGSCTMGAGQFCTNPGFVVVPDSAAGRDFIARAQQRFSASEPGVLLGRGVRDGLVATVARLQEHGAALLCGGEPAPGAGYRFANTLLQVSGERFLQDPHELQSEAFGPVALLVAVRDTDQAAAVLRQLEGSLTGAIYSSTGGADEADYAAVEPILRQRVGRLLNDKMPTGVAVSPAMNHGGPFPATGHPGFTAVGIPTSIARFTALHCYDNVRPERLPPSLRP
jgi:alpha-ketoglutaric semialdehyde dehydrogenase